MSVSKNNYWMEGEVVVNMFTITWYFTQLEVFNGLHDLKYG